MPEQEQKNNKKIETDRLDLLLLSNGKKIGLSFREMSQLRVRDLMKMVDIDIGGGVQNKSAPRASQRDIDRLFM